MVMSTESPEFQKESRNAEIERIVYDNYWASLRDVKIGRHVIALAVEKIADELVRRGFINDPKEAMKIVLEEIFKSPKPEDIKEGAREMIFEALKRKWKVYIWTVGDEGSYTDDEGQITYDALNFQKRKIDESEIIDSLQKMAEREMGADAGKDIFNNLAVSINAKSKRDALISIIKSAIQDEIKDIYVADDQLDNERIAQELQKDFPDVRIHTWWINNSLEPGSEKGRLNAFRTDFLEGEQARHDTEGTTAILVLDWDDTIYNETGEMGRMQRLVHGLTNRLQI